MRYEKTTSHRLIRKELKRFLNKELAPIIPEIEAAGHFPEDIFRKFADLGFFSLMLDEAYGGGGRDYRGTAIVAEELGKTQGSMFNAAFAHIFCSHWIDMFGTEAQKERYLPKLADGRFIGAIAITEPDAGSNVAGIITLAEKNGDHYVINGRKTFITNGPIADVICVLAVTDPDTQPRGISTFIVETITDGFFSEKPMKKLGLHCSLTSEIGFENCRVSKENLLGAEHLSLIETTQFFSFERVCVAASCAGTIEAVMDASKDYALKRKQFGVPIASFQGIQEMLADMATDAYAIGCMCEDIISQIEKGNYPVEKASMAKVYASEVAIRHTSNAIQIFGGYGYTAEFPVERHFRDVRINTIGGGTTQIQKRLIARSLLRMK